MVSCCIAALAVTSSACSNSAPATHNSPMNASNTDIPANSGGYVATDCVRPVIDGPDASGITTVSAELNGAWPQNPEIHASVTFNGSSQIQYFTGFGESISVSDTYGDAVTSAKVYVTSSDVPALTCNMWMRQP